MLEDAALASSSTDWSSNQPGENRGAPDCDEELGALEQAAEAFADLGGTRGHAGTPVWGLPRLRRETFFPLDEELELLPGRLTPGLEEILVRLGSWMPFAQAQRFLVDWMKLNSLSEATVKRHMTIQEEEARALEQGEQLPRGVPGPGSARLVVEVDGAMAPLVGGEWAEVETVVIGEVDEAAESGTLRDLSYFSRLTDAADFTRQALAETCRRGLDEWGQAALVSDGAEWIQGFGDFHCPGAVRILDFPHAAGYMAEIGRGVFEEGSSLVDEWQREQVHRLKHEGAGPVLEDLRVLVERQETDLRKPLVYLEKRESPDAISGLSSPRLAYR